MQTHSLSDFYRPVTLALVVLALLALTGCAARIDALRVGPVTQGAAVPVEVDVSPFLTSVQTPATESAPESPTPAFQADASLPNRTGNTHAGALAPKTYGQHRVRVTVPYRLPLVPGTRTTSREQSFHVGAPAACFAFDAAAQGVQGWTLAGLFDGGNPNTTVGSCTNFNTALLRIPAANWPAPGTGLAGLSVPVGDGCFPTSTNAVSSGFWAFDFISPNLENRAGWGGITAFNFRINSPDSLIVPDGLKVQALLKVRKPDGVESIFRQINADGTPRFDTVISGYAVKSFQFSPPAGSVPLEVRVRMFGRPAARGSDDFVNIDGVCPGP